MTGSFFCTKPLWIIWIKVWDTWLNGIDCNQQYAEHCCFVKKRFWILENLWSQFAFYKSTDSNTNFEKLPQSKYRFPHQIFGKLRSEFKLFGPFQKNIGKSFAEDIQRHCRKFWCSVLQRKHTKETPSVEVIQEQRSVGENQQS
jgi:hypothetical protein